MSEDVTEADVINAAIDSRWLDLHKAGPARVESYDANANTVTVSPVLWRQIPTDDGDYVAEALPQIPDVKIAWPRAGGFGVTMPIQKGDFVLLLFCDAPLGAWRQNGQPGDPGDPERHGLSGAVAIPGVYPDKQNLTNVSTTNMVVGKLDTPAAQIEITSTGINLGAGAAKGVARTGDKTTIDTTFATWVSTVTAKFNAAAAPMASFPGTLVPPTDFGTISGGSTKVKAED